jgi:hypothetical protein
MKKKHKPILGLGFKTWPDKTTGKINKHKCKHKPVTIRTKDEITEAIAEALLQD